MPSLLLVHGLQTLDPPWTPPWTHSEETPITSTAFEVEIDIIHLLES